MSILLLPLQRDRIQEHSSCCVLYNTKTVFNSHSLENTGERWESTISIHVSNSLCYLFRVSKKSQKREIPESEVKAILNSLRASGSIKQIDTTFYHNHSIPVSTLETTGTIPTLQVVPRSSRKKHMESFYRSIVQNSMLFSVCWNSTSEWNDRCLLRGDEQDGIEGQQCCSKGVMNNGANNRDTFHIENGIKISKWLERYLLLEYREYGTNAYEILFSNLNPK